MYLVVYDVLQRIDRGEAAEGERGPGEARDKGVATWQHFRYSIQLT